MVLKLNNNPLISVVVPIYNVEKYLRRCVESIRCQTYSNLEIILVDDGSPDSCGKICDAYGRKVLRMMHYFGRLPRYSRDYIYIKKNWLIRYLTCTNSTESILFKVKLSKEYFLLRLKK